jgi:hypothetical protein
VLDPLGQRFDVAKHHRAGALAAEFVPGGVHLQPAVGEDFAARDLLADAIDENLAAAAGEAAEPGVLQSLEHRLERQLRELVEVPEFGGAEAVDVDLRELPLHAAEQVFVPLERQLRVQAALNENLVAAEVDGFLNLLMQNFLGEDVRLAVADGSVERTEVADGRADVGVVDVPVDVVGAVTLGVQPARDGIGRGPEGGEVVRLQQRESLGRRESLADDGAGEDGVDILVLAEHVFVAVYSPTSNSNRANTRSSIQNPVC